jgi:hypothetical protein
MPSHHIFRFVFFGSFANAVQKNKKADNEMTGPGGCAELNRMINEP